MLEFQHHLCRLRAHRDGSGVHSGCPATGPAALSPGLLCGLARLDLRPKALHVLSLALQAVRRYPPHVRDGYLHGLRRGRPSPAGCDSTGPARHEALHRCATRLSARLCGQGPSRQRRIGAAPPSTAPRLPDNLRKYFSGHQKIEKILSRACDLASHTRRGCLKVPGRLGRGGKPALLDSAAPEQRGLWCLPWAHCRHAGGTRMPRGCNATEYSQRENWTSARSPNCVQEVSGSRDCAAGLSPQIEASIGTAHSWQMQGELQSHR